MSFQSLDKYPQTPLNEEQMRVFTGLLLQEIADPTAEGNPALLDAITKDFGSKVITQRVESHGGKLSPHLTLLISMFAEGSPGSALMYAHAVHMATPVGETSTVAQFAEIFAMGIPNAKEFDKAWDGQKIGGGNGIDIAAGWERK